MTEPHRISRCAMASARSPGWRLATSQARAPRAAHARVGDGICGTAGPLFGPVSETTSARQPEKFRIPNDYRPTRTINTDSGHTYDGGHRSESDG